MSAFIVSDTTINRIVSFLENKALGSNDYMFKVTGYELINQAEQLAKDMYDLNVLAVNARYNEHNAVPEYDYKFSLELNPWQILKSLQCWLYQCSEGDIPKTALYRTMSNVEKNLMQYLIDKTLEYQKATWA